MNEDHISGLNKLCRVCGAKLAKGKSARQYGCMKYTTDLNEIFSIDVSLDLPHIHPSNFCHPCKNIIYHCKKAVKEDRTNKIRKHIQTWEDHHEEGCLVCDPQPAKLGRPKKTAVSGRPPIISPQSAITYIKKIAPAQLTNRNQITAIHLLSDFQCPLCLSLLDRPIELTACRNYVCAECCCQWLRLSDSHMPVLSF